MYNSVDIPVDIFVDSVVDHGADAAAGRVTAGPPEDLVGRSQTWKAQVFHVKHVQGIGSGSFEQKMALFSPKYRIFRGNSRGLSVHFADSRSDS